MAILSRRFYSAFSIAFYVICYSFRKCSVGNVSLCFFMFLCWDAHFYCMFVSLFASFVFVFDGNGNIQAEYVVIARICSVCSENGKIETVRTKIDTTRELFYWHRMKSGMECTLHEILLNELIFVNNLVECMCATIFHIFSFICRNHLNGCYWSGWLLAQPNYHQINTHFQWSSFNRTIFFK